MNTYVAVFGGARFPVDVCHGHMIVRDLGSPRIVHYNKRRGWWVMINGIVVGTSIRVQAKGRWVQ